MTEGESMSRLLQRLDQMRQREEEELQSLCARPDMYKVLQGFMDRVVVSLSYLHNYEQAVSGRGEVVNMMGVYDSLYDQLEEDFLAVTGKEYRSEAWRQVEFNRGKSPGG
jgi:hypothetical protein